MSDDAEKKKRAARLQRRAARRRRTDPFLQKLERLGLRITAEDPKTGELRAAGRMPSGARATLGRERLDDAPEDARYRWTLTVQHATPADWTVGLEDRMSRLARRVGLGDVQTGDAAFDELVLLRGDEAELVAAMSQGMRRRVRALLDAGVTLEGGVFRWQGHNDGKPTGVLARLNTVARVAEHLRPDPATRALRLLRNAAREAGGVRRRNLQVLLDHDLADLDVERRRHALEAAAALPDLDAERPRITAGLEALLEERHCALEDLEPPALILLLRAEQPERRLAACARLGAIGGPDALPALDALADGLLSFGPLKAAARAARAAITERAGLHLQGALTLADAVEGHLSLAARGAPDDA
ncbi:MAG: hypothetical protein H6704_13585 [Myxococcales bacterium]|nr:hypothetical protein [Myxococcales bacterium]